MWWAKTRAAVYGVLQRVARKRARRGGGASSGGAGSSGAHLAGSKRGSDAMEASDRSNLRGGAYTDYFDTGGDNGRQGEVKARGEKQRGWNMRDDTPRGKWNQ